MYEFKYPFVPPAEDLAAEGIAGNGVRWEIYNTFCREFGTEEKAKLDRSLMDIFIRAEQRKRIERMKNNEGNAV